MSENKNILVYAKNEKMPKFKALQSLENFTFAPTLMYACLIPFNKLEVLKNWCNNIESLCKKNGVQIELRHYKGKAIYKIG